MSRKSIIILSTAMLLATTATGAFAGGSRHVGGNSASAAGVASNLHHPQAVGGEAHRSTLATTRIKKDDPKPCREPDNCGATDQGGLDGSGVFKGVIKTDVDLAAQKSATKGVGVAQKLPTTLVGVAQKSPSQPKAHDDSDQLPILDDNGNPVAVQGDPNQNGYHEPSVSSGGTVWFEDGTGGFNKDGDFESGASDGTAAAVKGPSQPSTSNRPSSANLPHSGGNALSTIAQ